MGDLAKYIAEVIEFVVAGILVLFSLLLLGFAIVHPDLTDLPDEIPLLGSSGAVLPVLAIAVIYAMGILAEGVSRRIFERGLGSLTVTQLRGRGSDEEESHYLAESARIADESNPLEAQARSRQLRERQLAHYQERREEMRMAVMARSGPLAAQIDGQLKRLRVERASALSGYIATVALLIELVRHFGEDGYAVRLVTFAAVLLVTVCARWLSHERLKRYLDSIIRCHAALPPVSQTVVPTP